MKAANRQNNDISFYFSGCYPTVPALGFHLLTFPVMDARGVWRAIHRTSIVPTTYLVPFLPHLGKPCKSLHCTQVESLDFCKKAPHLPLRHSSLREGPCAREL